MLQRYGDDGDGDGGGGDYLFSSGPHDGRGRTTGCCRLLVGCVSGRTPLRCTGVRVRWWSSSVRCGRLSTSRSRRANLGGRVQWCRREEGRLHSLPFKPSFLLKTTRIRYENMPKTTRLATLSLLTRKLKKTRVGSRRTGCSNSHRH